MNFLTQFVDTLEGRYANGIRALGGRADEYAHACLRTLEQIRDAVTDDEATHRRVYEYIEVTAGQPKVVEWLPNDAEWLLEAVTLDASADTPVLVYAHALDFEGAKLPLFGTTATGVARTVPGTDTVFPGGTALTLVSTTGNVRARFQFKVARMKTRKQHSTPGRPNARTDGAGVVPLTTINHAPMRSDSALV